MFLIYILLAAFVFYCLLCIPLCFCYLWKAPLPFLLAVAMLGVCSCIWFPLLTVLGPCLMLSVFNFGGALPLGLWRQEKRGGNFTSQYLWAVAFITTSSVLGFAMMDYSTSYISEGTFRKDFPATYFLVFLDVALCNFVVVGVWLVALIYEALDAKFKFNEL